MWCVGWRGDQSHKQHRRTAALALGRPNPTGDVSIYGFSARSRYKWDPVPPIHIVKNGNVTLAGVVANETDRNIAALRANGVSGVFSVDNNLKIEGRG